MPIEATAVSDDLSEQRVRHDVIDPQSQRQDELHQLIIVIVRMASTQEADLPGLERGPKLPQRFDVFVKGALACCSSKPKLRQHPERLAVIEIDLWQCSGQRGRRLWRQAAHFIVRCTTFHIDPDPRLFSSISRLRSMYSRTGMGSPKTAEEADDSCCATASRSVSWIRQARRSRTKILRTFPAAEDARAVSGERWARSDHRCLSPAR